MLVIEFLRNLFTMQRDRNERGASAVEYGLLVAGIAAVVIAGVFILGGTVKKTFSDTNTCIGAKSSATC